MRRSLILTGALIAVASLPIGAAAASHLAVDVWTDRGGGSVYEAGDALDVSARVSDAGYVMVYEIDSEGAVRMLFPVAGESGYVPGAGTLAVPPAESKLELVVQGQTGEGYLVALISREPFKELPWYLRPYDVNAQGADFTAPTPAPDEEGVTADGHIVGDPFVAMERIRRRIIDHPDDVTAFATSYTSYYVHEAVRYPRYLCNDCHRPEQYAWWSGYDPYYATCSVFAVQVNWGWYWGPSYWCGTVPYYVYNYRPNCAPGYAPSHPISYSSWNGWNTWKGLGGGALVREKPAAAPQGYVPPPTRGGGVQRGGDGGDGGTPGGNGGTRGGFTPPGYVSLNQPRGGRAAQRSGGLQPVSTRGNGDGVMGTRDAQRGGFDGGTVDRAPQRRPGTSVGDIARGRGADGSGRLRQAGRGANQPAPAQSPHGTGVREQWTGTPSTYHPADAPAQGNREQRARPAPRSAPAREQAPRQVSGSSGGGWRGNSPSQARSPGNVGRGGGGATRGGAAPAGGGGRR